VTEFRNQVYFTESVTSFISRLKFNFIDAYRDALFVLLNVVACGTCSCSFAYVFNRVFPVLVRLS
jgi:hypothetical protein